MMRAPEGTGIVLAGGRSSRMGQPKALLPFDGTPLVVRIVALLRRLFAHVVVVSAPGQSLPPLPATVVHDEVAYQGPVGGLWYGLRASGSDVNFVTSCDSAFLNGDLISYLVSLLPGYDVVVPRWDGRFQPLHAVYRRSVLPRLEEQLARSELRPVTLFDRVLTRQVDEDDIRRFDPDGASFFNMNAPQDYAAALTRWSSLAIHCTVELFGVARLLANVREIPLALPPPATVADVLAELATRVPSLVGRVIGDERTHLVEGSICNVNGTQFIRATDTPIHSGDRVLILPADAGG